MAVDSAATASESSAHAARGFGKGQRIATPFAPQPPPPFDALGVIEERSERSRRRVDMRQHFVQERPFAHPTLRTAVLVRAVATMYDRAVSAAIAVQS